MKKITALFFAFLFIYLVLRVFGDYTLASQDMPQDEESAVQAKLRF